VIISPLRITREDFTPVIIVGIKYIMNKETLGKLALIKGHSLSFCQKNIILVS